MWFCGALRLKTHKDTPYVLFRSLTYYFKVLLDWRFRTHLLSQSPPLSFYFPKIYQIYSQNLDTAFYDLCGELRLRITEESLYVCTGTV
jgi:hypothetical protein